MIGTLRHARMAVLRDHLEAEISPTSSDRIFLALVSLYFVLKPFYFWSSGLPQLSDVVLSTVVVSWLLLQLLPSSQRSIVVPATWLFGLFAFHATFINLFAMLATGGGMEFVKASFYCIFNAVVAVAIAALHFRLGAALLNTIHDATVCSVILQAALIALNSGSYYRATGQFNNPNQLSYYGLLSFAIIAFVGLRRELISPGGLIGLIAASWLVLSSLSKSGVIALAALAIGFVVLLVRDRSPRLRRLAIFGSFGIATSATLLVISGRIQESNLYQRLQLRFGTSQGDDSLSARGYDRIWREPDSWLFGHGEGGRDRYYYDWGGEFHSTLGNIQLSYGLIGTAIFVAILTIAFRRSGATGAMLVIPLLIYGLTHNGGRNTMFWMLLALMMSSSPQVNRRADGAKRLGLRSRPNPRRIITGFKKEKMSTRTPEQ